MKNKFIKAMATFAATFLMISVATVNVVWAAPKVPSEYTVGTINTLLAQKDRWKFSYKGATVANGKLQMDYQNGATNGEVVASPMVRFQKNQLIKFTYNSPFSTGALMQSYALFAFRMPVGDYDRGLQNQYYAFMIAPGAEFKNVWLCYSKEGMEAGGKVVKFSHKIAKDTDYVVTCGAVETANGIRVLLYIDDTCVIDLEDTCSDKKIEGDPLTKGKYIPTYNFNFYSYKDDYTIKGAVGTPLDLSKTSVDVVPKYTRTSDGWPVLKPVISLSTSSGVSSKSPANASSHTTANNISSKGFASVTGSIESTASQAESTAMTESEAAISENMTSQATESNQVTDSGKPEKKSPVALIVTIVVIVVVLAVAGTAYYFIQRKKANK